MDIGESSLKSVLPADPSTAARDWFYLRRLEHLLPEGSGPVELLDLGAGEGRSKSMAAKVLGERLRWTGVDIGDSSEVLGRSADAPTIDVYDGIALPYADARFDVVWCKQVLEHVRHPDLVIAEVARVLRPGELFVGSVSQLEPYHSRSIFNWTHYGVRVVLADHGLRVTELTPGVDGLLLMLRALFGYKTGLNRFFGQDTPLNQTIDALFDGTESGQKVTSHAAMRLRLKVAGHIHFAAVREAATDATSGKNTGDE